MLYNLDLKEELLEGQVQREEMVVSATHLNTGSNPTGMIVMEASRSEYERKEDSRDNKVASFKSSYTDPAIPIY
eukprot:CAMPEP_0185570762 /NCGR_PEP_ID=MMETSP0434-20130131/2954_1 /TAXON_ID=626734 ORGANISM="Favella taraikaensis, Strain Fe Narragansett Bay" /NCGR_SAMPLE_ID=MMETSP0434 /ASSEMBLY_ACC=CAM_ASM_000379 /LENGTH=73 /DNA_ID=CAMNT_0028185963 /DNA_START=501 /DNA_END=722 /DNA_ORIENTATION=-